MEEYWDIYDRERRKTGRTHRRGDVFASGDYHLIVHVCIFNEKNQLLIQQRVGSKKSWPNLWDVSAAGCAQAGEDSRAAAQRETAEELGYSLDLSGDIAKFSFSFRNGFDDWWLVKREIPVESFCIQKEEVQQIHWADAEEVQQLARQGAFIPYHFVDKLFVMRESMGAY
ncbi:MAG: NUDIX domain-containing protein [Lachnospiraceae bacterium]|nr:NUDIX domain-containing protein [Lachnospiraceae bacterium]